MPCLACFRLRGDSINSSPLADHFKWTSSRCPTPPQNQFESSWLFISLKLSKWRLARGCLLTSLLLTTVAFCSVVGGGRVLSSPGSPGHEAKMHRTGKSAPMCRPKGIFSKTSFVWTASRAQSSESFFIGGAAAAVWYCHYEISSNRMDMYTCQTIPSYSCFTKTRRV